MNEAANIVSDLAVCHPISHNDFALGYEYHCECCGKGSDEPDTIVYDRTCVWKRAQQWVKLH